MLVYLSYPIDRANSEVRDLVTAARDALSHVLITKGAHVFSPGEAFKVDASSRVDASIHNINEVAQEQAAGMVVVWPRGATSWGVPVEVERARHMNQPTVVLTDDNPTWSQPWGWDNSNIKRFNFTQIGDAVEWLLKRIEAKPVAKSDRLVLPYKRLNYLGQEPNRAYADDAGFDLYVSASVKIKPGQFVDIPCAVAVELPSNTWALLTGRSSTLRSKGLLVNQGIIDPGYRGELFAGVQNLSKKTVRIELGERVAQLILMPNWSSYFDLTRVTDLKPHPRGEKGFGSSGR